MWLVCFFVSCLQELCLKTGCAGRSAKKMWMLWVNFVIGNIVKPVFQRGMWNSQDHQTGYKKTDYFRLHNLHYVIILGYIDFVIILRYIDFVTILRYNTVTLRQIHPSFPSPERLAWMVNKGTKFPLPWQRRRFTSNSPTDPYTTTFPRKSQNSHTFEKYVNYTLNYIS